MAERRQVLRFPTPYRILVNSQFYAVHRQQIFPRCCYADGELLRVRLRAKLSASPAKARPRVVFSLAHLIALHRIYAIALYVNYPIRSIILFGRTAFIFLGRDKMVFLPLGSGPRTPLQMS